MYQPQSKLEEKFNPSILKEIFFLKNRPIQFRISVIKPVKQDQSSFFNI